MENAQKNGLASFSLYNIAFTVAKLTASIKWYQDVFGFTVENHNVFTLGEGSAEVAMMQGGGTRIEMLQVPDGKKIDEMFADSPMHLIPIGNKSIVFQVTDLALASKELEEKGVEFVWREIYIAGDKMLCSMIKDIDGNKINIFQTDTIVGSPIKGTDKNRGSNCV